MLKCILHSNPPTHGLVGDASPRRHFLSLNADQVSIVSPETLDHADSISHDVNFDKWEGDMKSRVYWNCLMNETILVQELHLPPSGLARLEEFVPIPKFISFETVGFAPSRSSASSDEVDDSYFQYHFLAQVAHRIILTRIRHSLYFYCMFDLFLYKPPSLDLR